MNKFLAILFLPSVLYAGSCHLIDTVGNGMKTRVHIHQVSMKECLDRWWSLKPGIVKRTFSFKDEMTIIEATADEVDIDFTEESSVHELRLTGTRKY